VATRLCRALALIAPAVAATTCTPFKDDAPASDAGTPFANPSPGPPCDPSRPFVAPTPVPGLSTDVGTTVDGLRLSPDSRTAYFHSNRSGGLGNDDIYAASRATPGASFGDVTPIPGTGINTPADEVYPSVRGDGLDLVFARGTETADPIIIYRAIRGTRYVSFTGVKSVPQVSTLNIKYETFPFLREDGRVLYFSAEGQDIYQLALNSPSSDASTPAPAPVNELNTKFSEVAPVVTPDDLTMYYGSDRADGVGGYDVWMATRASTSDPFGPPTDVTEVNSPSLEWPTFVTRDGCTLYFTSNRDGYLLPYVATRQRMAVSD
jgi:WD40-like Beta Propeller Repeat